MYVSVIPGQTLHLMLTVIKKIILLFIFPVFSLSAISQVSEQRVDTIIKKLDSLRESDSAGFRKINIQKEAYNNFTMLRTRDYIILLGSDIKQEFTKPFHMTGKDWVSFCKFAAVAVVTNLADESIQKNALKLRNDSRFVRNTGKLVSQLGGRNEIYTLAAFGAYGIIFKNEKVKTTALLATQALIIGSLAEGVLKTLTGRTRPNFYSSSTEAEPKFTGPFGNTTKDASGKRTNSSFPSGHTTVAFAAATVFAVEYKNEPLIPIVSYSIASLVGVSRITENKHWASDVVTGAALGYLTGRQVSYNYHRLARMKNQHKSQTSITFNLQCSDWGKLLPGLIFKL